MSFNGLVKEELASLDFGKTEDVIAEVYGFLLFATSFGENEITVKTETEKAVLRLDKMIFSIFGFHGEIEKSTGKKPYIYTVTDSERCAEIVDYFGHTKEYIKTLHDENIAPGSFESFMRGVLLSAGNIREPEKEYRIEIGVKDSGVCVSFIEYLSENDVLMSFIQRGDRFSIYTKDSSLIEDMLVFTGAVNASLELMNVKIYKDVRNKTNRVVNLENANYDKTLYSAMEEIKAIKYIIKKNPDLLSGDLMEIARLRLDNGEMSLNELSKKTSGKYSKSKLYRELKKIVEIYKSSKERKKQK